MSRSQDKDKNVAISGLVDVLKEDVDTVGRYAASALRGTQDKDAISRLIDLLKDENPKVHSNAAFALSGTHDKEAISELINLLKQDPDLSVMLGGCSSTKWYPG